MWKDWREELAEVGGPTPTAGQRVGERPRARGPRILSGGEGSVGAVPGWALSWVRVLGG